jgi:uncharacterized protein YbjT (DUF2867 family)
MHALLIGATGATGADLLQLLLDDRHVTQVDVFVRRPLKTAHPKLRTHVVDFNQPAQWSSLVKGDVLFSCLGTTLKVAGSKEAQWKVDHDFQYEFAKAAHANGVGQYILISAAMASSSSKMFYPRMKGVLEDEVRALGFRSLTIFNPPVLKRKASDRSAEVAGVKVIEFLNKFGLLMSNKPLPTSVLAKAMMKSAKLERPGVHLADSNEIWKLAE